MAARAKLNQRRLDAREAAADDPQDGERVQKLLAEAGLASRRGAEALVRDGRVTINGRTAALGDRAVLGRDDVEFDGEAIRADRPRYWMLNKPKGVLSSRSDPEGRKVVISFLPEAAGRLFPVGRLDGDSEGLLLLTNDGALTDALLHPRYGSEREYRVTVRGSVERRSFDKLERGVMLEDGRTAAASVSKIEHDDNDESTTFNLTLKEGRKRQIRRSLVVLGHPVKRLVRVRMGPIRLGRLRRGEARELRADEQKALRAYADERRLEASDSSEASGTGAARKLRRARPRSARS